MKKYIQILFLMLLSVAAFAQGGNLMLSVAPTGVHEANTAPIRLVADSLYFARGVGLSYSKLFQISTLGEIPSLDAGGKPITNLAAMLFTDTDNDATAFQIREASNGNLILGNHEVRDDYNDALTDDDQIVVKKDLDNLNSADTIPIHKSFHERSFGATTTTTGSVEYVQFTDYHEAYTIVSATWYVFSPSDQPTNYFFRQYLPDGTTVNLDTVFILPAGQTKVDVPNLPAMVDGTKLVLFTDINGATTPPTGGDLFITATK